MKTYPAPTPTKARAQETVRVELLGVSLSRNDVLKVARDFRDRKWAPAARNRSRGYEVRWKGLRLPAKALLAEAWSRKTGERCDTERFSGGAETNRRLEKLGFKVAPTKA